MKLLRIGNPGSEVPVVLTEDERYLDLRGVTGDIDGTFLGGGGLDRAREAVNDGTLPAIDVTGQRVGAPLARPGVVLCIGMNYAAHAAESGSELPEHPVMFYKAPNTVVGPYDDLLLPRGSTTTDLDDRSPGKGSDTVAP